MKILITGAAGQLGYDLVRVLHGVHELYAFSKRELNVTDSGHVLRVIDQIRPDVIIHAAAYTNVDQAEFETETAYRINAAGSKYVAAAANRIGAKMVYISTDYVFDGKLGRPYKEADSPSPLSVYGYTKLAGERYVRMLSEKHFIVRTAWLFGTCGKNFVKTIHSLALKQNTISVVADQTGSPTYSLDLARFIARLVETEAYGIYHAVNEGSCSRFEFAAAIIDAMNANTVELHAVGIDHFRLPAPRPRNSSLEQDAIRRNRLPLMRDWKSALIDFIANDLYAAVQAVQQREENFL